MKFRIISVSLLLSAVCYFVSGCGDQPLFDELAENRVKVVIKGTYESNDPQPWVGTYPEADSVYINKNPAGDVPPTVFMLDIAGLKVASGKHDQYFANYREVYSPALNDSEAFFNGTGVLYENNDMRPNFVWSSVHMYLRKMLFDSAKEYSISGITPAGNTWDNATDVEDLFHEEKVKGLNFNLAQVLTYYDYLKMNYLDTNRIFPLSIPVEDGFIFDYNEKEIVLEIRLVIKNFVKKYEYEYTDSDGNHKLRHFYALSDWLRNIKRNEPTPTSDTSGVMGGNVLAVARYYVPGKTATITGNAGAATPGRYVVAIKSNHTISEYQAASTTRPTCDNPKTPRAPVLPSNPTSQNVSDYTEALLQYYLQYETYKKQYDAFVVCVDSGSYEADWNDYDSRLNAFKIPPLVTWADNLGNFALTNVPVGQSYYIYQSTDAPVAGLLPNAFEDLTPPVTVIIDASCAGKQINIATPTTCN